ncbi:MAG: endospore germination permease [Bacillota bacterium]|nr:endospore germination permease [Bacillota bacterium]
MLEGGVISNRQATLLVVSTILPTSIMFLPALISGEAKQDAWISIIILTAFGVLVGLIIASLGTRFPGQTIIHYSEDILGRPLGKAVALIYPLFFIYINAFIIREFAEFFIISFMPETPISVFIIGLVFVAGYAVYSGLEPLARINEIILPLVLILILLIVGMNLLQIDTNSFFPVLEKGFLPPLKGAYPGLVFFAETMMMLMFIPYLRSPSGAKRTITLAVLILGFFQLLVTVMLIGVFGGLVAGMSFPLLQLARNISLARGIFHRMEHFILVIWVAGGFIKVGVFYYCAVLATAQWLNLRSYKALVPLIGVLLAVLSVILWENVVQLSHQIAEVVPPYFLTVEVAIPFILLVLAWIRGKGGKRT